MSKAKKVLFAVGIIIIAAIAAVSTWSTTALKGSILDKDAAEAFQRRQDIKVVDFYSEVCTAIRPAVVDSPRVILTAAEESVGTEDTVHFERANDVIRDSWVSAQKNLPVEAPRDVYNPNEREPMNYQPSLDALRSAVDSIVSDYPEAKSFEELNEVVERNTKIVSDSMTAMGEKAPIVNQGTLDAIRDAGTCDFLFNNDDKVHDDIVVGYKAFHESRDVYQQGVSVFDDSAAITSDTIRGKVVEYQSSVTRALEIMENAQGVNSADILAAYRNALTVADGVIVEFDSYGVSQESLNDWAGRIVAANDEVHRSQIRFMRDNEVPNQATQKAIGS